MERFSLAVLIPAYREGATIGAIVAAARAYAPVIVVDDCSPDDTGRRAADAGAIVVRNECNMGYEATLNHAFENAQKLGFDCAVTMDADGEHDPAVLAEFRKLLVDESIPLVIGIRRRKQRLAEVAMCLYVKLRFGVDDILCGMKGYHLSLVEANGGFDHSYSIGTELAINAIEWGTPFSQVRVPGRSRQDAPRFDRRFAANWRILKALWRVVLRDITRERKD